MTKEKDYLKTVEGSKADKSMKELWAKSKPESESFCKVGVK